MKGLVYVVDDDPLVRRSIERLIHSEGLEARGFESAVDFLQIPRLPVPSCLLLDYQLPLLDGLELQATLIGHEKEMPVIFLTGRGTIPLCVRAMQGGAVDFLTKPVEPDRLIESVERALELDQRRLEQAHQRRQVREDHARLTMREQEVFRLIVRGMLNKQIGSALGVTEKTIMVHRARVMEKLGAESVADLVRLERQLVQMNLLPGEPALQPPSHPLDPTPRSTEGP